jgi:dTDP-4-dehydrorhamnose reductase
MDVMILGHTGMLGHMVIKYFKSKGHTVNFVTSRFGNRYFNDYVKRYNGDCIINCVGAIPQRTDNFKINTDLPIWLSNNAPCRVIHPGTDCEMDNDVYGTSKRLASEYIKLYSKNTKILKSSIVGPEHGTANGLMAWLGAQEGTVTGYTKAIWNGNTTLEWSKYAEQLLCNWDEYDTETILEGNPISKHDMLHLFAEYYNKTDLLIEPVELGKDKCLVGTIKTGFLSHQLNELKQYETS